MRSPTVRTVRGGSGVAPALYVINTKSGVPAAILGSPIAAGTCNLRFGTPLLQVATDCAASYPCSISINVPQKSFGCRNSTGLSCAPIAGSPLPSTRAPSANS